MGCAARGHWGGARLRGLAASGRAAPATRSIGVVALVHVRGEGDELPDEAKPPRCLGPPPCLLPETGSIRGSRARDPGRAAGRRLTPAEGPIERATGPRPRPRGTLRLGTAPECTAVARWRMSTPRSGQDHAAQRCPGSCSAALMGRPRSRRYLVAHPGRGAASVRLVGARTLAVSQAGACAGCSLDARGPPPPH